MHFNPEIQQNDCIPFVERMVGSCATNLRERIYKFYFFLPCQSTARNVAFFHSFFFFVTHFGLLQNSATCICLVETRKLSVVNVDETEKYFFFNWISVVRQFGCQYFRYLRLLSVTPISQFRWFHFKVSLFSLCSTIDEKLTKRSAMIHIWNWNRSESEM